MYTETLKQLNLSKNESIIYETLIKFGELSISAIARESGVNRRNVYDSMDRLREKGLVFEIRNKRESVYKAVDPIKLREILAEKSEKLESILPNLREMYENTPHDNEVFIYKGLEGWKNYMKEVVRSKAVLYTIGGKGQWADEQLAPFLENFMEEALKAGVGFETLFDHEVISEKRKILDTSISIENIRALPKEYSTKSTIQVFDDQVVILDGEQGDTINDKTSFFIIKNKLIADSFRIWFKMMWQLSKPLK
jgi:sugar-specific transcriptional regulator TrmB